MQCCPLILRVGGCPRGEEADHRHGLLLRACDERRGGSAAQEGDEIPSLHEVLASPVSGKF
jgi:hypothetical protein